MIEEGLKKLKEKKISEALEFFNELDKNNPNNPDILFYLGNIYYELNDLNKSLIYFEKSYKYLPESEIIINNYAITLQSLGKIEKAKNFFKKLLYKNPNNIRAYYRLFRMNNENFDENYLNKIKSLENKNSISLEDKSLINYIFSKIEKNNNNLSKEIEFLNKAHNYIYESKEKYNLSLINYYFELLSNKFNEIQIKKKTDFSNSFSNLSPVFIIGLPRSGSTLVETLLSQNNKKFYSYGETGLIDNSIRNQIKNKVISRSTDLEINEDQLIDSLNNLYSYSNKKSFIDKSLENFFYIDVILKIFPRAKFIHTYRNKYDAAIAIHQSMLIYLPWAHSMNNILKYILNYEKILNYYKKKYPDKILNINLENLSSNPKKYTKNIFKFCNLDWNENVLEFYNKENLTSKSSSFLQVRNKIQKYEKYKYQPYYFMIENELIEF